MIAAHSVPRSAGLVLTLAALLSLVLSACAGAPSTPAASPPDAATMPANSPPSDTASAPSEVSNLPVGVYRSELTVAALRKRGVDDRTTAGIWTFTVHPGGAYEVSCVPIEVPGVDCGNGNPNHPGIVEVGDLRGTSPTWFVFDTERLVKLTGCTPHSDDEDGCADGGYHLRWKKTPKGLEFTDFVGLGKLAGDSPVNAWTVQPWTRIK